MSTNKQFHRSLKSCPIEKAILKAKASLNMQKRGEFKKPFHLGKNPKTPAEFSIQKPFELNVRKKLEPVRRYREKENIQPASSFRKPKIKPEMTISEVANFYLLPQMLSPIKDLPNTESKTQSKMQFVEFDLKSMIDIFAKNIENLANGSACYETMKFADSARKCSSKKSFRIQVRSANHDELMKDEPNHKIKIVHESLK